MPFSNYIKWIEVQDKEASKAYWDSYLSGFDSPTHLPRPIQKIRSNDFIQKEYELEIGEQETKALNQIATKYNVTLFSCLKSIWSVLLSKVNNGNECVFGTVVSGRPSEVDGIESMVGLFINTIPFRSVFDTHDTFSDLLEKAQKSSISSEPHHYISLSDIQEATPLKSHLFDHILVYENYPVNPAGQLSDSDFKVVKADIFEQANYDLGVVIMPGDKLIIKFLYNSSVHDEDNISNLCSLFIHLKDEIIRNPDIKITDLHLISDEEEKFLTNEFNANTKSVPVDITLIDEFNTIVRTYPDKTAIIDNSGSYSYQELDKRANSIAHRLGNCGTGSEENIGIIMDQGIDMAAAILGILKAGASFVPIDPLFPKERINFILDNADIHFVVTDLKDISLPDRTVICADSIEETENRINKSKPHQRAYIIYTSGTTGNPKGVEVSHSSVLNTLLCRKTEYLFDTSDVCLQLFSSSFDGFITAFFTPVLSGASLVLTDNTSRRSAEIIAEKIELHNVTNFIVVPSLLNEIVRVTDKEQFNTVRLITLAGENVHIQNINEYALLNTSMEISQEYGVTEAAVMSTMLRNQQRETISSIGSPTWNTQIYILDDRLIPAPIGIEGNIYIGGIGLARGYYNNPTLTSEKFIRNPFNPDERIYQTGDTGRWLPDGNIEYYGRSDFQIKIRGLRIEPGEIETSLLNHPDIHQAFVTKYRYNEEDILCAYYVADTKTDPDKLRTYLLQHLPAYMVPSVFYHLERMPVTTNGKVERNKLPAPGIDEKTKIVPPETETESALLEIWSQVLKTDAGSIGIDSDFFQLGGHSLRAISLIAKIHKQFNTELPLDIIFRCPTIRQLAPEILEYQSRSFENISSSAPKPHYELSPAQKRQFILYEMNRASTGYNMPAAFELDGVIDIDRLENTFKTIISRHESLRTSFMLIDNEPGQIIHEDFHFAIERLTSRNSDETQRLFHAFVKPFDLTEAPLIRVALVDEGTGNHILFIDMHHIIADGTSIMLLLKEFTQVFMGEQPAPLKIQYKDFAEWKHKQSISGAYQDQSDYWRKVFEDEVPVLDIPTDYARPPLKSFEGAQKTFSISEKNKNRIIEISRKNKTTPFVVLLAIIKILLSRLSGQNDLVVGTSSAGRNHADLENVIGMFINTLPIRSRFTDEFSFIQLIDSVRDASVNAFRNQDFQFEELLENLILMRDTSRNPLFDIMFIYQNIESGEFSIPGVSIKPLKQDITVSKFDLTFEVFETDTEFIVNLEYCSKLFLPDTIERFMRYFMHITDVVCNNGDIRLKDISLDSEEKLLDMCMDFNRTKQKIPFDKTIIELFENQVREIPDQPAIISSSETLSYEELNERSELLSRALAANGVRPNTLVAVFGGRSVETVIGILAVLKSGGAYLPIDVNYPEERIRFMLKNADIRHIVSDRLTPLGENMDCFIDIRDYMSYHHYEEPVSDHASASDLAYVIFTSGSTGNPKGVKVKHSGVVNTLLCRQSEYDLQNNDVCAQLFSPSFDGFVTSFFTPLVSGASVLLINDEEIRDVGTIIRLLADHKVSHFISVPVLYNEIIKNIETNQLPDLRSVTLAGDKLAEDIIRLSGEKLPATEIAQEYGVTEASVMSTMFRNQQKSNKVLIGKPVWNTQIFILDKYKKIQPVGVPGEIHIAGVGVAEGYLHNEELTQKRFFANPYNTSGRMYATGDMGRWTKEGNIEFLGRNDHQVKIRGFRIELGEIESKIRELTEIENVVVVDKLDFNGNKYLCAYFIKNQEIELDTIRGHLISGLPGFMLPHQLVDLDEFPVTENGKIHINALRKRADHFTESNIYVAPKTELEELLVEIWKDVLAVEKIGIKDNYFFFGGDSIKAIQIATKLKESGYNIDISQIFQLPTIEELALYIQDLESDQVDEDFEGYIPFSPNHKAFIEQNGKWQNTYQTKTIQLLEPVSADEFNAILNFVYRIHDGLRLVYKENQLYLNKYIEMNLVMEAKPSEDVIQDVIKGINIDEGPLFRALINNTSVVFILHELLEDDWTWKILLEDVNILLHQQRQKIPLKLPPRTGSIKEYAILSEKYLTSAEFEEDIKYWSGTTCSNIFTPDDQTDNFGTETIGISFNNRFSEQFLSSANDAFHSHSFELFISALLQACSKINELDGYSFDIVNENRDDIFGNYSNRRTIGKFKTHFPVYLPYISEDLSTQIRQNIEILRGIPKNGLPWFMSLSDTNESPILRVHYVDLYNYEINDCLFTTENFFDPEETDKIQVNCFADPGQLEIIVTYPAEIYDKKEMKRFSELLKSEMERICEYCVSREFIVETPDDLSFKDISMDALDSLESFFDSDNF